MIDLVDELRASAPPGRHVGDCMTRAADEIERLRDVLLAIEMLTATGDGLGAQEAIEVHLLAAEGRSHDPRAWRLDPSAIARLRSALRPIAMISNDQASRSV